MLAAQRNEAKRDEGEDLFSTEAEPIVLAAAATRKLKDAEQKVVLFGAGQFASDNIAFWPAPGREMYPGNAELVVNCALWVAGTDHLISVSPEALLARRLSDPGTWALPLKAIIIAGLPAVVLVIGLVVYVVRRR
jgi:hypothetical protein